ncbi:hypothetical protein, partial [Thauera aminoaromatica]|uniref:hypothetical protein n=1 Tax=Thauera aminoaromatica TaxID=164330 RepID=UPI0023F2F96C
HRAEGEEEGNGIDHVLFSSMNGARGRGTGGAPRRFSGGAAASVRGEFCRGAHIEKNDLFFNLP